MKLVNVPAELAEQALVVIAAHVPPFVDIGLPLAAGVLDGAAWVLTPAGTWWVRPGRVERLVELHNGRLESAAWSGGVELSWSIT